MDIMLLADIVQQLVMLMLPLRLLYEKIELKVLIRLI